MEHGMAQTGSLSPLRVGFFSRSVVSRVARERGLFVRHGLCVSEEPVPSSPSQFRSLLAGEFDLVLTSPDNVAAYRLTDVNPLGMRMDVRILLALDAGLGLSLMSIGDIHSIAELRGRTVAVDVPSSGFALAMFSILQLHGLQPDRDFTLVSLGSTPGRREALLAGQCDATLLNAGHDIRAESAGCRRLARIADTLSPYLGTVLAATGPWLDQNADAAQRFADAWLAATDITLDPAERGFVEPLLAEELTLDQREVGIAYEMLQSGRDGLIPGGLVEDDRLLTVLSTRASFGGPDTRVDPSVAGIASSGIVDRRLLDR
jgi:ABC-type nitrate/sulfonate/bicarbonate transport system substrate-binding protein